MIKSDTSRKFFFIALSLFVVMGISLSTFHYHNDAFSDFVETEHQISNDHYNCLICGSVFNTDSIPDSEYNVYVKPVSTVFIQPSSFYQPIVINSYDGRAPPLFG